MREYKMADISVIGPRVEEIRIPWIGGSMNTIWAGVLWSKRNAMKDDGAKACMVAMRNIKPFSNPVRLEFRPVVGKGRRSYDVSNYALTNKVIEDCLVKFKILEDDTPKFVTQITTFAHIRGDDTETILRIIEI